MKEEQKGEPPRASRRLQRGLLYPYLTAIGKVTSRYVHAL